MKVSANWDRVQTHFQEKFAVDAIFFSSEIDKVVDKLIEDQVVVIEVDSFLPEGEDSGAWVGRRDQAVNDFKDMVLDTFFKPSLEPKVEEPPDGWDKFAATTERIKIGAGVINNWTRNIGLLAATWLTLDDLAPNRMICGIGAWWDPLAKNVGIERRKPLLAMRETVDRGFNAVRICAAPLLVAGDLGLDDLADDLPIEGLGAAPTGGFYGQRTRWYDAPGGYRLDVRARLFALAETARRHGVVVILASWEYQQSPSFAADPRWFRAIEAVPLARRYDVLADAFGRLLDEIRAAGLIDVVANAESAELSWVPLTEIEDRHLHPGFANSWPHVRDTYLAVDRT